MHLSRIHWFEWCVQLYFTNIYYFTAEEDVNVFQDSIIFRFSICWHRRRFKHSLSIFPLTCGGIRAQLSHQPVFVHILLPVWTLGRINPHRTHVSTDAFASRNGPNDVLVIPPPSILCAARTLNPDLISHNSATLPLSSIGNSRNSSRRISSGKSRAALSRSRCSSSLSSCLLRLWNRFLIPLSVLPGIILLIFAQWLPMVLYKWKIVASSVGLQSVTFRRGFKWLTYRSRHCLPVLSGKFWATKDHFIGTRILWTILNSSLSSSFAQAFGPVFFPRLFPPDPDGQLEGWTSVLGLLCIFP